MSQSNVIGGLKAAINNPNVSEEAKERDRQRLSEMGQDVGTGGATGRSTGSSGASDQSGHGSTGRPEGSRGIGLGPADDQDGPNQHRVAGGYKATLSNPRTSDEAKAHAEEKLAELEQ